MKNDALKIDIQEISKDGETAYFKFHDLHITG